MFELAVAIVLGYLIGSFPTSIVVGKLLKGIDIRDFGSGNAGATNVLRVMGWKTGIFVLLFDAGKGVIATLFIARLATDALALNYALVQIIVGSSAVVGHIFTVFAGFRGGKGVGTAAGMIFSLYPLPALCCLLVFLSVVLLSGYVSLGSMLAAACLPLALFLYELIFQVQVETALYIFAILIVSLIIFAHRKNIKRLIEGTENRFGKSPNAAS